MDYTITNVLVNNLNKSMVLTKIIQWLSCRDDIFPEDIIRLMKPFLNNVPINNQHLRECYNNHSNLGKVLGSGSVSYVFELLQDDDDNVIKIYKNTNTYHDEIFLLRKLLEIIKISFNITDFLKNINLNKEVDLFDKRFDIRILDIEGFLNILEKQVNYNNEFNNFHSLKNIFNNLDFIVLPEIKNFKMCNTEIVMSRIRGFTYQEIENNYAEYIVDFRIKCLIAYFWMIYSKVIHLDLHEGNYLYIIDQNDDDKNKVAILDYGMIIKTNSIYWNLWKSYIKKDISQLNIIIKEFIIESIYDQNIYILIKKLKLFKRTVHFTEWLDDLLIQLNKYGLKIKAEVSIVLLNFIFLGKCKINEDSEESFDIDLIDCAINKMIDSKNENLYKLGLELKNDLTHLFEDEKKS